MLLSRFVDDDAIECGCDEAGRGCLAGPVVAAAVILPSGFDHPHLNDSKKVTEPRRRVLRHIIEREAIAYCIAEVSAQDIDDINILQASVRAMHLAIDGLQTRPDRLLIDGNYFRPYPTFSINLDPKKTESDNVKRKSSGEVHPPSIPTAESIPNHCIVGGDAKYMAIAAASILAKTYRDELMVRLSADFPGYSWHQNKGYPTEAHRAAIELFGLTPYHRKTFKNR